MHGVTGALGDDVAFDAAASQREIADEVEHLVADVFIFEAERAVFRAFGADDDGVVRSGAANQTHVAKHLLVSFVSEGAGGGDFGAVGLGGQVDACLLLSDGSGEVDGVLNAIGRSRDRRR